MLTKNGIIELSKRNGFFLSKKLGQNFLIDKNVRDKIVRHLGLKKEDAVFEIGPGLGSLTEAIAASCRIVYAVEIDRKIYEAVSDIFSRSPNVRILNGDVIDFDMAVLSEDRLKVVGALPFYITSPIIQYLMQWKGRIDEIYIVIQKEVADRLAAKTGDKDYGAFTLFVRYHTKVQHVMDIKKNCFFPVPKVDSSLLKMTVLDTPSVMVKDDQTLFKIIRQSFGQRRKTLLTSLSHKRGLGLDKDGVRHLLKAVGIDPKMRPEGLSLEQFAAISDAFVDFVL